MKLLFFLPNLIFFSFILFTTQTFAQGGQYDIRLNLHSIDLTNNKVEMDIEVRAEIPGTEFNISDQNYRITYDPTVFANPSKVMELTLSGFVNTTNPVSSSIYDPPHTLTGSVGDVVSYNVELAGGDGYPLNAIDYVPVGRFSLDILNPNADISLSINTKDINDFPPSFIGEKFNDTLYVASEGSYNNYSQSIIQAITNDPPSIVQDVATTPSETPVIVDILANDSDSNTNLDLSTLTITTAPPASEGVATILGDGTLEFVPASGFSGTSTIVYEICDEGTFVPSTHGNLNTVPPSEPVPPVEYVQIAAAICQSASVNINVEAALVEGFAIKVLMEGAYTSADMMSVVLNTSGNIPLQQPYNAAPWNYTGTETIATVPANMTDWVLVTVRTGELNSTVVSRVAGLVNNDGNIVGTDGNDLVFSDDLSAYDSLYVAVYHRNHVGIMSANRVVKNAGSYVYDFTDSETKYFGGFTGVIEVEPGTFAMIGGDYNGNGQVQNSDFNSLSPNIGLPGYLPGDLNLNGQVQNSDVQEFLLPNLGRGALFSY